MPAPDLPVKPLRHATRRRLRQAKYHGAALVIIVLWCLPACWIAAGLPLPAE
ncbi:hypothetical protein OIE52_29715 [Streptomyces canus]|uniref:hypothetical protein n=1 Tax=Streptomyces canus TaxID=58343 RepID=UPI003245827F